MGIYQYMLRAETKVIDGVEIGQYGYAYKHGWGFYPGCRKRIVAVKESKASDAAYKNRNVRHFSSCLFKNIEPGEQAPVYATEEVYDQYTETLSHGVLVGHLVREGRRLRFIPKELHG